MSLTSKACCFFVNETQEWLKADGTGTRILTEALVIKPEELEQTLKEKQILSKGKITLHILEATYVLKRKVNLS
jgi:hypothetical protein